jgi:hypothetical protein
VQSCQPLCGKGEGVCLYTHTLILNAITVEKLRETVLVPNISTPAALVVILVVWLAGCTGRTLLLIMLSLISL